MTSLNVSNAIHSSRHAAGGPDEITPAVIGADVAGAAAGAQAAAAVDAADQITAERVTERANQNATYEAFDVSLPAVAKGLGILPNNPAHEVGPAWDAAMALLVAKVGGILDISPNGERWYTARPPQSGIGGGQLAQLPIPNTSPLDSAPVFVLRMGRPSRMPWCLQTAPSTAGPAIVSTYTAGVRIGGKNPSVIGGLAKDPTNLSLTFSAAAVICDNLHIQVPTDPTLTGLDMSGMAQGSMRGQCTVENITYNPPPCTHPWAYGVIMPGNSNNVVCNVEHLDVLGFYGNFAFNEHTNVDHLGTYFGIVGRVPYGAFSHSSTFKYVSDELCRIGIGMFSPVDGTALPGPDLPPTGQVTFTDEHWDVEHMTVGDFARVFDIDDQWNWFRIRGRVSKVYSGSSLTGGNLWVNGGSCCIYVDNASLNPASIDTGTGRVVLNPASDGGRWVQDVGVWGVDANGIGLTTPSYSSLLSRQTEFPNGRISATVGVGTRPGDSWGLAFRIHGQSNMMLLTPSVTGAGLFKNVWGTYTEIPLTPALLDGDLVVGDRWEVEYHGAQYRVFKNGTLIGTAFDDTYLSGCKVGLFCSSDLATARFTNFNAAP